MNFTNLMHYSKIRSYDNKAITYRGQNFATLKFIYLNIVSIDCEMHPLVDGIF